MMGSEDALLCNVRAMKMLNEGRVQDALRVLEKAKENLEKATPTYAVIKMKAATFNNLGCLYKRMNEGEKALSYLTQALEYEKRLPEGYVNTAGTHLNLCSIKSQLKLHDEALDHAVQAIGIINSNPSSLKNFMATLVAAHYNAGIECEFLGKSISSQKYLQKGLKLAELHLGSEHSLTRSIDKSLKQAAKRNKSLYSASRVVQKNEFAFRRESNMFNDEPNAKKIRVDTTPWQKIDDVPILKYQNERKVINEAAPRPYGGIAPALDLAQRRLGRIPESKVKKSRKVAVEKVRPANIHHNHNASVSRPPFTIAKRSQPRSSQSLSTSPFQNFASSKKIIVHKKSKNENMSQVLTTQKLNKIAMRLENLQQKLTNFEQNYKDIEYMNDSNSMDAFSNVSLENSEFLKAAVIIQKSFRRYIAKKQAREMQAVLIHKKALQRSSTENKRPQKIGKLSANRESDLSVHSKHNKAASLSMYSIENLDKRTHKKSRSFVQEIIMIQAHIRGFLAKKYKKRLMNRIEN